MAEDINTSGKDTTKVTSDGVRTHFNSQNVVLSSIDDIQKWYAKQQAQLLENTETSRLSTATEKIEIDGLATTEEHTEGLQTNVEDVVDENHNEPIRKLQTQSMKAVAKTVVKLVKALVSFIAETAPVSLPIIGIFSVIIVIVAFIGGYNPVFGEGSSNDTINSYVSYISNYENEKSVNVNWCIPLAYIYVLDDRVQYDAGEQYLLNKFDEDGLLTSMSSSIDYYNYFNSHSNVVLEFYSKSGISSTDINNDDWYSFVKDIEKEPDDFMSLINERLKDYETTYAGTGNGKFIYPTNSTTITAGYPNYSDGSYHGGVDFAVPTGTSVGASADGIVVVSTDITSHSNCKCKYTSGGYHSYGRYVVIDHGNGVRTYYCHLSERKVNVGDTVKQGQVIGISGSTGNSSGPHCHFEVRVNNTRVNPTTYLEGQ